MYVYECTASQRNATQSNTDGCNKGQLTTITTEACNATQHHTTRRNGKVAQLKHAHIHTHANTMHVTCVYMCADIDRYMCGIHIHTCKLMSAARHAVSERGALRQPAAARHSGATEDRQTPDRPFKCPGRSPSPAYERDPPATVQPRLHRRPRPHYLSLASTFACDSARCCWPQSRTSSVT